LIAAIIVVLLLAAAVAWTFISPPGETTETATGPKVTEPAPAAIPSPPAPAPADPPAKPEPAPTAPEAPVPPKSVWLDVKTKPVGAQVKRGDEILGVTPLRLEVARADKASLSFALANYVDETREVALTEDVALSVDLKPVPKTKAKAPPPKKKKPTGKKR
jgi:hypothetical protein